MSSKAKCIGILVSQLMILAPAVHADEIDTLRGKFAFNWLSDPAGQKCVPVGDKLLTTFKSAAFKCDLTPKTNTSAGVPVRNCAKAEEAEYLIFDTQKDCDEERETQASNE